MRDHLKPAAQASDQHLDLARFNRERQTALRPDFQTERDGLFNIFKHLGLRLALADTTRDGRAFNHPNPVLVAVKMVAESFILRFYQARPFFQEIPR